MQCVDGADDVDDCDCDGDGDDDVDGDDGDDDIIPLSGLPTAGRSPPPATGLRTVVNFLFGRRWAPKAIGQR